MRILNENNVEIISPDLNLGYLKPEKIFVQHHDAIEFVPEVWHYEVVAEYPNGGKDIRKVIDIPGVAAKPAWDEYETIQRYIPYTDEELAIMRFEESRPTILSRLEAIEFALMELVGVSAE